MLKLEVRPRTKHRNRDSTALGKQCTSVHDGCGIYALQRSSLIIWKFARIRDGGARVRGHGSGRTRRGEGRTRTNGRIRTNISTTIIINNHHQQQQSSTTTIINNSNEQLLWRTRTRGRWTQHDVNVIVMNRPSQEPC